MNSIVAYFLLAFLLIVIAWLVVPLLARRDGRRGRVREDAA